jgi:Spy/CpxP family protein refolding chaperone
MSTDILKAPVGRTWDPKVACAVVLALVFLCGAAAGALAMNMGAHNLLHRQPAFDTPQGKAAYFERITKELDLTPAQTEQMQSILNDFWQYYRTVLSDSKAKVEQILNESQRQKFEKLLKDQQPK